MARALTPPALPLLSSPQRIWNEWQKHCLKVCDDEVRDYWICREEQGLWAPLRCGKESDAMKAALQACGRDEAAFGAYRDKRLTEVEADIVRRLERAAAVDAARAGAGVGVGGGAAAAHR